MGTVAHLARGRRGRRDRSRAHRRQRRQHRSAGQDPVGIVDGNDVGDVHHDVTRDEQHQRSTSHDHDHDEDPDHDRANTQGHHRDPTSRNGQRS